MNIEDTLRGTPTVGPADDITARLAERARAEGLLDVAYTPIDSPLGTLTGVATDHGLLALVYPENDPDGLLGRVADEVSPRILEAPARLDPVRRELDDYFAGRRHGFDLPIDWALSSGFYRKVLEATARIPFGETSTYAGVAAEAGSARAVRAAGTGLKVNPVPIVVPCHRVLRTGGQLGQYAGGTERKQFLLELEGAAPAA